MLDKLLGNGPNGGFRSSTFTMTAEIEFCGQLPLDQWYDLTAPGTYTLSLAFQGILEMRPEGVVGNTVTFTRRP